MEENALSDIEKSDSEIIVECERMMEDITNVQKRDKRQRESEGSGEEGFITVVRPKPKRYIRSASSDTNEGNYNLEPQQYINEIERDKYEVCLFSTKNLPKQMALARFLRDENITNINKIKYKSAYKVFIVLNDKGQAENLLKNEKLLQLDIRAQLTDQKSVSYGIIRNVDLDMNEKEILENVSGPFDILSAKRMRRINYENKWVECETVRLCFKSVSIPLTVEAYGIKFKVEKYVFPVTQCSACWKFGHTKKFCSNKVLCPKCGEAHDNCETVVYKCLNCKGNHMALNKSCPAFVKEKEIRLLMSEKDVTYKKALELFLQKNKEMSQDKHYNLTKTNIYSANITASTNNLQSKTGKTYSDVVQTAAAVHQEEENNLHSKIYNTRKKEKHFKRVDKKDTQQNISMEYENTESENLEYIKEIRTEEQSTRKELKFDIWNLIYKLKNIVMSQEKLQNKVLMAFKEIVEECKLFICSLFRGGDYVENFFKLFNG
jgi:hypothetical protein